MPSHSVASSRRALTASPRMTLAAIGAGAMGALWLWWQDQPRDLFLSQTAGPQLRREVLIAQSAHIDAVSGATYTSSGYA